MDTPTYFSKITVGGASQDTQFIALPEVIITQQSGQLNLECVDDNDQPFAIDNLVSTGAEVQPYNSSDAPVTLGTGVVSYTGEIFTLTAASSETASGGTFTLTVAGETTSGIAYNADESVVLAALEALASRSPGDFRVLLTGGSNISDSSAVMEIELSGGFDLDARSTYDPALLTPGTAPTFATEQDQSTVQNYYSVTWVKDTIPSAWSTYDPEDRQGSISITVNMEETGTADRYKVYTRFNVRDGSLQGNQQSTPTNTFLLYYLPTYDYDVVTTDADPTAGFFRMDSTTLSAVTELFIADDNKSSVNMSTYLQNLSTGASIYLTNPNTQTQAVLFSVSGASISATGYTKVQVTYVDSGSVGFTSGLPMAFDFSLSAIADGSITNAKLADMAQSTIKGRAAAAGTGVPVDLSTSQVKTMLGYLEDIVDDTTPQLGGSLDVNSNKIISTSNGDIDIEPNGTGNVLLGNFTLDADQTVGAGQDDFVLTYDDGTGLISLEAAAGGGGSLASLSDVTFTSIAQGDIMYRNGTEWVNLGPGTSGQFLQTQGAAANPQWSTPAGSGDVVGPASATDNAIARYDSTTGKLIQDSGILISDSDDMSGLASITVNGNVNIFNTAGQAGMLARRYTGAAPTNGQGLFNFQAGGYDGTTYQNGSGIIFTASETWNGSSRGSKQELRVVANGTTTVVTAVTIDQDSSADFAGDIKISGVLLDTYVAAGTDNNQTGTTYTLVLTDEENKTVWMNNASANVLTVPTNASVAFAVGTKINVMMEGAGATTITGDTGVTVNGTSAGSAVINNRYQGCTLTKRATNTWIVSGDVT